MSRSNILAKSIVCAGYFSRRTCFSRWENSWLWMGDGYRLGTLPKMILLGVIIFPPSIFDLGYFVALTRLGRALQFQKYRHAWDRFVRATICDSSGISVWRVTLLWGLQFLYVYILMRRRQCMFRQVVRRVLAAYVIARQH